MEVLITIMTWADIIIKGLCILIGIVFACVVTLPNLAKAIKQRKAAKTEAEKEAAKLAIYKQLHDLMALAEENYDALNNALKQIGQKAGPLKKDKVMSEMRDFCDENHYEFNKEEIAAQIDELTGFMNTGKKA